MSMSKMRTFLAGIAATFISFSALAAGPGSIGCQQLPPLTGDVTTAAGTCGTTVASIGGVAVGTMATQNANAVAITGGSGTFTSLTAAITAGSINNTPIGATTPNTGAFTTLSSTGAITLAPGGNVNIAVNNTSGNTNIATGTSNGQLVLGSPTTTNLLNGAFSFNQNLVKAFWGKNGVGLGGSDGSTYTDNTTTAGSTLPQVAAFGFPSRVITMGNTGITATALSTVRLGVPSAGANLTATNTYSLDADGGIHTAGNLKVDGTGLFTGLLTANGGGSVAGGLTVSSGFGATGTVNIDVNNAGSVTSIGTGTTTGGVTIGSATNNTTVGGNLIVSNVLDSSAGAVTRTRSLLFQNAISAPFWGVNGLGMNGNSAIYTDTTSTGTIAKEALFALPANTLAASAATTVTGLDTLYLPAPIAGTNVTATNRWSLETEGGVNVGSNLFVGGVLTFAPGQNIVGNNVNIQASNSTGTTNIGTGTTTGTVNIGNSNNSVLLGANTTAPNINVSIGGTASLLLSDTLLATDSKIWYFANGGNLSLQARSDSGGGSTTAYNVTRGTTWNVASHDWYTSVTPGTAVRQMHLDATGLTIDQGLTVTGSAAFPGLVNITSNGILATGNSNVRIGSVTGGGALQTSIDGTPGNGNTNYWDFHATGTGVGAVYALPGGTDANVSMTFRAKGTGSILFVPNGTNGALALNQVTSGTDGVTINTGVTGAGPVITSGGTANTPLNIQANGTGNINLVLAANKVVLASLTASTPVYTDASKALTSVAPTNAVPVMSASGTNTFSHIVTGTTTLAAGTATITFSGAAVFTSTSTYVCEANDNNATPTLATAQISSATSMVLHGTGTDVISWSCTGS